MDTAFVVRLRSFGFLHPGRERLRTVLKRSWPFIPGSTLYGAVAAALIRLDGVGAALPGEGEGGYHRLLRLIAGELSRVRFTPLLPVGPDQTLESAEAYCRQAQALYENPVKVKRENLKNLESLGAQSRQAELDQPQTIF
jgi:CRISPR-associated Cas5-like protein